MKKCFKCNKQKRLSSFYKHKSMADGHLNKCKGCTKSDNVKNRHENLEYYRNYDRCRGNRQREGYVNEWRKKYPNKYKAQTMVGNYVRDGKLFKEACEVCGERKSVHAHHDDYLRPLNVRWLCPVHHKAWHDKNGEGANG